MTAAVDVETAEFVVTDFDDLDPSEYTTGIVSSASVPFVFPFTEFRGRYLMDALSCGWNVNMLSAINKCMTIVDDPTKIIVDIIVMYPETNQPEDNRNYTTLENYLRKQDIRGYYTLLSDISAFIKAHPDIQYRYLVQASETPLPPWDLLSFTPELAEKGIELGKKDAKATVEMGEGESFKRFEHDFDKLSKDRLKVE